MTTTSLAPEEIPVALEAAVVAARDIIEQHSDLPIALIRQLRDTGALRLLTPVELGGHEAPLTTVLRVYEEFGRLDASVGWIVWNANIGFIAGLMDQSGVDRIWRDGEPEPIFANSGMPGVATPVDGGYRVSGTWKIVSGVNHAHWLGLFAIVMAGDRPATTETGAPDVRPFMIPRGQFTVRDTWHVNGMRGSGSNDVVVDDLFVPADMTMRIDVPGRIDRPLYRGYIPAMVLPGCTAVALGVARSAIEEAVRIVVTKHGPGGGTLADQPRTQAVIAQSQAELDAARLLLFDAVERIYTAAEHRTPVTGDQRSGLRAAMSHAAQVCRRVLVAMYELCSSSSIYQGSHLERQFRDGMVALQHANHAASCFEPAGRVRLGMDPGVPLF